MDSTERTAARMDAIVTPKLCARCERPSLNHGGEFCSDCLPVATYELVKELHTFVMEFAKQMETLGKNPMVSALMPGMFSGRKRKAGKDAEGTG